jgi:hypothetical protein
MGRDRGKQTSPDLFSTDAVRDASTPPPPLATKDATAQPEPQRHVLPKNLRNAVKHLNDEELDLLHAATLEEMRRRGRLQPNVGPDSAQAPRHAKRSGIHLRTKIRLAVKPSHSRGERASAQFILLYKT